VHACAQRRCIKRGTAVAGLLVIENDGCRIGGKNLNAGGLRLQPGMADRVRIAQPLREQQADREPQRNGCWMPVL